ncbi:MAG: hypothetical protein H6577_11260 [Lewinellaceae bacterium]|nr:hypothetical protein [Lewinellaceae bacterium]
MAIYQILKRLKPFPAIHYGAAPRLKSWVERMSLSIGADFEMAETVSGTHYGAAPRLKPWVERMSLSIGADFETVETVSGNSLRRSPTAKAVG